MKQIIIFKKDLDFYEIEFAKHIANAKLLFLIEKLSVNLTDYSFDGYQTTNNQGKEINYHNPKLQKHISEAFKNGEEYYWPNERRSGGSLPVIEIDEETKKFLYNPFDCTEIVFVDTEIDLWRFQKTKEFQNWKTLKDYFPLRKNMKYAVDGRKEDLSLICIATRPLKDQEAMIFKKIYERKS